MQFIFASDKEKGYGLLYTDTKRTEAEKVQQILDIPIEDGMDVYGFISFGSNSNQPLFFEIKKDVSYPRGAYYVHGLYQNADPTYYPEKRYKQDLFTVLINQEQLDKMRTEGIGSENFTSVDTALLNKEIPINTEAFTELLTRIYRNEKVMIAVDDDVIRNV